MTRDYRSANVVNVAGAGCSINTLIPARIRVEALHAIYTGGVGVGRIYLAAGIEGGFEIRLIALWTALDYNFVVSITYM